jgi:hypothetical protein
MERYLRTLGAWKWGWQFLPVTLKRVQEGRKVCVCLCACLCVSPAKYFLHYTANPISSFRKPCNVNSRAPFTEQLGPCLPKAPIHLTANKMHTERLSLPGGYNLDSLPHTHPNAALTSLFQQQLGQGNGPTRKWGKRALSPSQAQKEPLSATLSARQSPTAGSCAEERGVKNAPS